MRLPVSLLLERPLPALSLLVTAALIIHGPSLWDGLFLDDHWHRLQLGNHDWSFQGLLEAATIEPDRFIHTWWQDKPVSWRYIRPVALFIAKLVYHCSDGSVKAWHGISLVLHVFNALLIYHLAWRLTLRRPWALAAGLLFVVYSHNVFAVAWLAAQNIIIQTFFTLLALLAYVRASGLQLCARESARYRSSFGAAPAERGCSGEARASDPSSTAAAPIPGSRPDEPVPPLRAGWFASALLLWLLAVLSRENAVILPAILAMLDLAFGGRRHLHTRLPVLGLMFGLAGAFFVWRVIFFDHPMPDFYFQRPQGDPGRYALWALAKLMHFVCAAIWLSPMAIGPSGRFNPFAETPGDCLFMTVIIVMLGVYYFYATRGVPGWWIWPAWILLSLLPVVPILATPHSGYMPSVAFAIAMVLAPAMRDRVPVRPSGGLTVGVTLWFLIATHLYMPIYRPMWYAFLAAERSTIQRVINDPPPAGVREIFFINLPFTNIYAGLHLKSLWDADDGPRAGDPLSDFIGRPPPGFQLDRLGAGPGGDFRVHVLTYAPDLMLMDSPCVVEQLDAHRLCVTIGRRPYFGGALGRFLIEGMRRHGRFSPGEIISTEHFVVNILEADEHGVWKLEFTFPKPLCSPQYTFYLSSTQSAATRLRFHEDEQAGNVNDAAKDHPEGMSAGGPADGEPGEYARPDRQSGPIYPHATQPADSPGGLISRNGGKPAPEDEHAAGQAYPESISRLSQEAFRQIEELLSVLVSSGPEVRMRARPIVDRWIRPVLVAWGAPVQDVLDHPGAVPADWQRLADWWRRYIDAEAFWAVHADAEHFAALDWTRGRLLRTRAIARRIIQSDVYLTGPPFPGPR